MYKTTAYLMTNLSNLHAGSGNTNYGIVDRQIQRDSATELPVVHASSLKGAVRDHMECNLKAMNQDRPGTLSNQGHFKLRAIFGKEIGPGDGSKNADEKEDSRFANLPEEGLVRFHEARALFIPMRSDKRPFYHVTSLQTLADAREWLELMGIDELPPMLETDPINESQNLVYDKNDAYVEDILCKKADENDTIKALKSYYRIENLAILNEKDFTRILKSLPIIARNRLDNGKSVNLWYEEVLPRRTVLLTAVSQYDLFDPSDFKDFQKAFDKLHTILSSDIVQVGANASIGYGLCRFKSIGGKK
jgi:CRISPR-associated protein Cmr4